MHKCNCCESLFDTPKVLDGFCDEKYGTEEILGCPECFEENYFEVDQCTCCGEYFPEDEMNLFESGELLCRECLEEYENEEDKVVIFVTTGLIIKNKREALDMTQGELAEQVGVSIPMISQIEKGTKNPSFVVYKLIAKALNCTLDELAG